MEKQPVTRKELSVKELSAQDISARESSDRELSDRKRRILNQAASHSDSYPEAISNLKPAIPEPTFFPNWPREQPREQPKEQPREQSIDWPGEWPESRDQSAEPAIASIAQPSSPFERRSWQRWAIARTLRADLSTLRYIFSLFLATRAVLVLIGLVSYAAVPKGYGKQVAWSSWPLLDMWGVWDSLWYMDIAQNGYSLVTKLADYPDQTNFPFFPLYPLLMRFISVFTSGDPFLAGLVISNGCLLIACYILYKLAELEWGSAIALRSVKYLFLFPVSFILSGVFTESLYLCISLLCFYLAKKRRWWLAGLCGGLLSATRTLGVLIAIPLLLEYARSINFKPANIKRNSLFIGLVPLGLLAFSLYNFQATGDFLFFKTNQAAWDREILNPLVSFWQAASQGISEPSFKKLLECAFFVGAFGLMSAFYKKIGLSYWLFGMYSIWIPLSAGVASMPRFTLSIFPLFVALAALSQRKHWNLWLTVVLGGLQGALMVLWCTGHGLVI